MVASRLLWLEDARENQIPPEGDWLTWLIMSGRGWGKTRTGAEWIAHHAITQDRTRWAVVAPTFADARDTCAEGESGLINILNRYKALANWNRSIGEILLTNGSRIKLFSAEEPDRLRGPQHHGAWCDELAAWVRPEAYDQLQFGLRLGERPQTVITTTPKPVPLLKNLLKRDNAVITRGSTYENRANLASTALAELEARYGNTRLGRQELQGELLEDMEGALWTRAWIEDKRLEPKDMPPLYRIVVAIDPAVTSNEDSDETGIVVAGATSEGHFYVLEDATLKATPDGWGRRAVQAFNDWSADKIIAETNNGGDMIIATIQQVDRLVPVKKVVASRGKQLRAEPISALYEQGRVHHVGMFSKLEDQMVTWTPESRQSPDRLDALVWALTELKDGSSSQAVLASMATICPACKMPNKKTEVICVYCNQALGESSGSNL
jgi:phage terminase large subunit-like protein